LNFKSSFFTFIFCFSVLFSIAQNEDHTPRKSIPKYTCDYHRLDVTQWLTGTTRKLDVNGIVMNNNQYHPLGIVHFGMLSYNYFVDTKDSVYYHHFINQIKYFKDTSKVDYFDNGKLLGLPYTFNFKDLKAPWYSGMTQGWAMVFLFRYYHFSGDREILSIIEKIAQFMLKPVEQNGTIGKTPEGYTWVEEYPNSKQKPQVLNGYINGLLGLKEYIDFFDEDTLAKRIHDETYVGLKKSLTHYDTPTWTGYDRKGSPLNNQYMQYQVFEMQDLYSVYGDKQFLDQMKLWCFLGHKKYIAETHLQFKLKGFDLSVKMDSVSNGMFQARYLKNNALESADTLLNAMLKKQKPHNILFLGKKHFVHFDINKTKEINSGYILLDANYTKKHIEIEIKDEENTLFKLKATRQIVNGKHLYTFTLPKQVKAKSLKVTLVKTKTGTVSILDIAVTNNEKYSIPFYSFHVTSPLILGIKKYALKVGQLMNGEDLTVFYKSAPNKDLLAKEKWRTTQQLDLNTKEFSPVNSGMYQFLIVYKPLHNWSFLQGFELIEN
jgi:hypothetical protein